MLAPPATDAATGSPRGPLSEFPPHADWQAIADRLYASNCDLVKQVEALQSALQQRQQELDVRAVQLLSLEEAQATKATEAEVALHACQARDREQLRAIATLSERLEISQARTEQLEQECLALQATCREQAERTTCAQKEIQELHARLQQQQQQTAQAQEALERYLTEQGVYSNRSNAWPPPIISAPGSDRITVKTTTTALATQQLRVEATTTHTVPVDPWQEAQPNGPIIETTSSCTDDGAENLSDAEFPFDAILDDGILDDTILNDTILTNETEPLPVEVGALSATDWIAPLVQSPSGKKKHKTLATILLPEF